jgi:integrase
LIESNPAIGIARHTEQQRKRLITPAELQAIRQQCGPRLRVIVDLLALTGQRIGDVLAIRRGDLTDAGIRFRQQKTDKPLVVAWSPALREAVERAKALNRNVVTLTLLQNRMGKAPDYRTIRDQWAAACVAAGVSDAHLHDLRAMALTRARSQGKDATALAGHSSPAMTARYLRDRDDIVVEGPDFGQSIDSA